MSTIGTVGPLLLFPFPAPPCIFHKLTIGMVDPLPFLLLPLYSHTKTNRQLIGTPGPRFYIHTSVLTSINNEVFKSF